MKIKTCAATPLQLNWLVAKCEGYECQFDDEVTGPWLVPQDGYLHCEKPLSCYNPSTNWSQGGPIIEREGIDLYCNVPTNMAHDDPSWRGSWRARYHRCGFGTEMFYGPTPLIAAMRCFCVSKLGEEVEVPDEITNS